MYELLIEVDIKRESNTKDFANSISQLLVIFNESVSILVKVFLIFLFVYRNPI